MGENTQYEAVVEVPLWMYNVLKVSDTKLELIENILRKQPRPIAISTIISMLELESEVYNG
jgi:hypothetical protein